MTALLLPVTSPAGLPRFRLCMFGLLAVVMAVHSNSLLSGFFLDDESDIVQNVYIRDLRNIPGFFTHAQRLSTIESLTGYRPLFPASITVDYWWSGGVNPVGMHATQLLLFLLLSAGVLACLTTIFARPSGRTRATDLAALSATLVFGLHPLNSEIVNYLSARSELLSVTGAVWAVALYLVFPRLRPMGLWLLPMGVGALAKPVALVVPGLWIAGALLIPGWIALRSEPGRRLHRVWGVIAAGGLAAVFFAFLRHMDGPYLQYGATQLRWVYLRQQSWSWLHYLRLLLWPAGLSAEYPQHYFNHWTDPHVIAGFFGCFALLAGTGYYAVRRPPYGRIALFGVLWYFISLAPSSSVIPLTELIREYRATMPVIGLILAAAACGLDLALQFPRLQRPLLLTAGTLAIVLGGLTHARNRIWRSETALYENAIGNYPDNLRAVMALGRIYYRAGEREKGRSLLLSVAKVSAPIPELYIALGDLYLSDNNPGESERYYKLALATPPESSQAHYAYGHWLEAAGRPREAIVEIEKGLARSPSSLPARWAVMSLYYRVGDFDNYCRHGRELSRLKGDRDGFPSRVCQPAQAAPPPG